MSAGRNTGENGTYPGWTRRSSSSSQWNRVADRSSQLPCDTSDRRVEWNAKRCGRSLS